MTTEYLIHVCRETLVTAIYILAPILGACLIIGLLVGIFQAITQIHEMTLAFVPKIVVVGILIFILLPWFLNVLVGFTLELFTQSIAMAH